MRRRYFNYVIFAALIFAVFTLVGCGGDSDEPTTDGDTDAAEDADSTDAELDGDDADGDQIDGDADTEDSSDGDEEEADITLFNYPHDGKLYAAANRVVITPTTENYPCVWYMGGTGTDRKADGVHDDLEARIVILAQDDVYLVLVALDLVGWSIANVDMVWDALEPLGVNRDYVVLSSTHTHAAPDTMGVWGPDPATTGRCPEYEQFLVDSIVNGISEIADDFVAVTMTVGETEMYDENASHPYLQRDSRYPEVLNNHLTAARFDDEEGHTVSTIINWHSHPEQLIESSEFSADFPRWTRNKIEEAFGGTAVYFSGTVGGLLTSLNVDVPLRTETGEAVLENGEQVYISQDCAEKSWSLGYVVAEHVIELLSNSNQVDGNLNVTGELVRLPFDNIIFVVGLESGVLTPYDDVITDDPDFCGWYGCMPQRLIHAQIGSLHFVTLPGELFAESSVGREEFTKDWGEEFGEHTYPAIQGYRDFLPEGHFLIEIGLANNEIGYIVPQADFESGDHPNGYEDYFTISEITETLVRESISRLLQESTP